MVLKNKDTNHSMQNYEVNTLDAMLLQMTINTTFFHTNLNILKTFTAHNL